ncbi:MAG: hypothetical protein L3J19_04215 [Sulfurimonas sp.]|nr:hypothetical protein [Sulfurimonas sp.]
MYITVIFVFFIIFSLVMIGLYLSGKQDTTERKLSGLIAHVNSHKDEEVDNLRETVSHARTTLERFEQLENLTEEEFLKEEKILKDLIAKLSLVKDDLAKVKAV